MCVCVCVRVRVCVRVCLLGNDYKPDLMRSSYYMSDKRNIRVRVICGTDFSDEFVTLLLLLLLLVVVVVVVVIVMHVYLLN